MPRSSSRLCQYPVDEQTPCHAPASGEYVCSTHSQAYFESYQRYKDAADYADALSAAAQLEPRKVRELHRAEVKFRLEDVDAYIVAREREKTLRIEHGWSFFGGKPDEGHRARLQWIEQQLEHSRNILRLLQSRLSSL
ncbi:hypothetical protein K466DRAFT_481222, partial [Polyporus arcularius HHB13444]